MKRFKIAQLVALVATVISVIGLIMISGGNDNGVTFIGTGFIIGVVSYIFGGLGTAISSAFNIGKVGFLFGAFPFNVFAGLITIIFAILAVVCLPIFPVRKAYKEYTKNNPTVIA